MTQTTTTFAPEAQEPKTIVKVIWPTNINNKMGCDGFIHIDMFPIRHPGYRKLETTLVEISTADGSHPPVLMELLDIMVLSPDQVREHFTLASHGMTSSEFADYFWNLHHDKLYNRQIGLYKYKKAIFLT